MRLVLACLIVAFHGFEISYGISCLRISDTQDYLRRAFAAAMLPMFFALSGFLVAGSLERARNLQAFLSLRVLRIIPALTVEVTLSAVVLGPLLTALPLHDYFTNRQFYVYFANILGDIHYLLPGVFLDNPYKFFVNRQLWTLPFELLSYAVLSGLALFRLPRFPRLLLGTVGVIYAVYLVEGAWVYHERGWTVNGGTLVMTFLFGMILYVFRSKIPWSFNLFLEAAFIGLVLLRFPVLDILSPLPLAYCAVYLGLLNPVRNKIALSGDYSYGLFLYSCPLQQALVAVFPGTRHWYMNAVLGLLVTLCLAVPSWWFIEKPALSLRRFLTKKEIPDLSQATAQEAKS